MFTYIIFFFSYWSLLDFYYPSGTTKAVLEDVHNNELFRLSRVG